MFGPSISGLQHLLDSYGDYVTEYTEEAIAAFIQAGEEMSDTSAEAIKPDLGCSWVGHSEVMGARVGDETVDSCRFFRPLRVPLVIHPVHHT